ncbi:MAG TPA: hypothetical protein VNO32_47810, partial [Candidatus Acidoferrum sp.]|nr:hypothetical protein [Candidatus Acidoferrum sp.]
MQVLGFASIGLLTPLRPLYPLAVRQSSALPTASSGFHLTADTLAVQLTLPLAGCVEDLHLQVSAPCRAHHKKAGLPLLEGRPKLNQLIARETNTSFERSTDQRFVLAGIEQLLPFFVNGL